MSNLRLQSVVWQEGAYYVSQCLNVDVSSFGETKAAALENLKEALELRFESEGVEIDAIEHPEVVSFDLNRA